MPSTEPVFNTHLENLELLGRGKVRDLYAVDDAHLLIVATDRLSAFDVVLPNPIPGKGAVLTELTHFWFGRTADLITNHLSPLSVADVLTGRDTAALDDLTTRAVVVRRLEPLPIEAIVRGYIIGSGWSDYRKTGQVCGIALPVGLRQAERLPEPLFTPSTKAAAGDHDENIDFDAAAQLIGAELAQRVRELSIAVYSRAAEYAWEKGIIIADTKLEFGMDDAGELVLIDEVLTPDSSRFWPADQYEPGTSPPSYDKQFVRDYLESQQWNKRPPAPTLPDDVVRKTAAKYQEAKDRLTVGSRAS